MTRVNQYQKLKKAGKKGDPAVIVNFLNSMASEMAIVDPQNDFSYAQLSNPELEQEMEVDVNEMEVDVNEGLQDSMNERINESMNEIETIEEDRPTIPTRVRIPAQRPRLRRSTAKVVKFKATFKFSKHGHNLNRFTALTQQAIRFGIHPRKAAALGSGFLEDLGISSVFERRPIIDRMKVIHTNFSSRSLSLRPLLSSSQS